MGWVAHGRFLGKVAFDSGLERRKSPGWVEWGEGISRQGRGCENSSTGASLEESQRLGDGMAVSVLCNGGSRTEGKGKKGARSRSVPESTGAASTVRGWGADAASGSPPPPPGIREATGPPKSIRSGGLQPGLPTQQPRGLGQVTQLPRLFHGTGTLPAATSQDCGEEQVTHGHGPAWCSAQRGHQEKGPLNEALECDQQAGRGGLPWRTGTRRQAKRETKGTEGRAGRWSDPRRREASGEPLKPGDRLGSPRHLARVASPWSGRPRRNRKRSLIKKETHRKKKRKKNIRNSLVV